MKKGALIWLAVVVVIAVSLKVVELNQLSRIERHVSNCVSPTSLPKGEEGKMGSNGNGGQQ